jgi:hypothetical protein
MGKSQKIAEEVVAPGFEVRGCVLRFHVPPRGAFSAQLKHTIDAF